MIGRRPLAAIGLAAIIATGCGAGQQSISPASSGSPSSGSPSSGTTAPTQATSSASASLAAGQFRNPVLEADFPDPFVLRVGADYFAYATTDGAQHLQIARSPDLVAWTQLNDPLPKLPLWSSGDTWAPEVAKTSAGYVLYYTAHDPDIKRPDSAGSQCITVALSDKAEGPFVDLSKAPLVCQGPQGGSIDATQFQDGDGQRYLIWKNDGNCCNLPTRFSIQRLTEDGLHLTGKATDMGVVNDKPWEGGVIEAPTLVHQGDTYYLLYSANGYDTELYAVGYATAKSIHGPYVDAPENPILASAWGRPVASRARGPGHQSVVADDHGALWIVYHAWDQDAVGYANGGKRTVWIDTLTLAGGKAVVDGPHDGPLPVP